MEDQDQTTPEPTSEVWVFPILNGGHQTNKLLGIEAANENAAVMAAREYLPELEDAGPGKQVTGKAAAWWRSTMLPSWQEKKQCPP